MDSRVGSEFAGYRIESILGRGGMGVVYLAEDPRLDRKVALKVLPADLADDQAFRERFIRESQMAARLEHPNIVPVYEAGEAEGQLFIAMRYVRGSDLASLLDREGSLALERAVSIVSDVAAALDEAHAEGLVHRDVKPANILLTPGRDQGSPERAHLTDFGVTRRTTSRSGLTQTGQFMGTVDYAAPEQIEGKDVDARADVYSLGCVLYHCLTGQRPFIRESDAATMYAHLRDRPPRPSDERPELPRSLDDVVATAMAKSPADRYSKAGELAAAATAASSGRAVGTTPRRRRRRMTLATVGTLVVAVAVVLVAVFQRGGSPGPTSPPPTGRVAGVLRINPTSARVSSSLPIRPSPNAVNVAVGDGFLWVMDLHGLRKVNPAGTVVGDPIAVGPAIGCTTLGGLGCQANLAAGEGSAWVVATPNVSSVLGSGNSGLARVDARTNTVRAFVLHGVAPGGVFASVPLAVGEGWVWVIDRNPPSLLRIDPHTGDVSKRIRLDVPGDGIGIGLGSVWVRHNSGIQSFLSRVDPAGHVLAKISLPGSADGLGFGGGNVWVSDSTSDELVRIDPATNTVAAHFRVGTDPQGVAVDQDGNVWVNLSGVGSAQTSGEVVKVEASSGRVAARVPVGGSSGIGGVPTRRTNLVFAFGSIWVA